MVVTSSPRPVLQPPAYHAQKCRRSSTQYKSGKLDHILCFRAGRGQRGLRGGSCPATQRQQGRQRHKPEYERPLR